MISETNQLEMRHFKYFKVLAEQLHYGKAAEVLLISQSALSQQIKQLEHILDTSLFERTQKKITLNRAGELFYNDCRQVLSKVNIALNNQALLKKGNIGQMGIGFVASAMESILPQLLGRFNKECPNIKFNLVELNNQQQLDALRTDTIDIGFMRSNQVDSGMKFKSVFTETFSVVLPKNHPINAHNFEHIGQLADESFILFPNDHSPFYYQQIINLCADRDFTPNIVHKSIHVPAILKLIENGMGVSIIPTSFALNQSASVRFIELKDIPQRTQLYAVWNKMNDNTALPYFLKMLN